MLDNIKYLLTLKSIDKNISENNFELAMSKLNALIKEDYRPSLSYLKRGKLCKKLFMYEDAYSDFTHVIANCADKKEAYYERAFLNFEISNFYEAITDSNTILEWDPENIDVKRVKLLSLIYSLQFDMANACLSDLFDNKFDALRFLFNETAKVLSSDEYSKGLQLLKIIDMLDKDNPIKLLKEATIYGFVGDVQKQNDILLQIENVFPKYFVSHFRFYDMYEKKDLSEICFLLELSVFDKNGIFSYPMKVLEGYKNHLEGHIIDSRECFEKAIEINPTKPEAYVLLAQTLQLMAGYDNPENKKLAEENYKIAEGIYLNMNLPDKAEDMRRQLKHLNSSLMLH